MNRFTEKILKKLKYNHNTFLDKNVMRILKDKYSFSEIRLVQKNYIKKVVIFFFIAMLFITISLFLKPKISVIKSDIDLNKGSVMQPSFNDGDRKINSVVTLSYDGYSEDIEIDLNLKSKEPVDQEVVNRLIDVINEDLIRYNNSSLNEVETPLNLPYKNVYSAEIKWESSSESINVYSGEVKRNPREEGDEEVRLRLTVRKGEAVIERHFNVRIKAEEKGYDQMKVENAKVLLANMVKNNDVYTVEGDSIVLKDNVAGVELMWTASEKTIKEKDKRLILILMIVIIFGYAVYKEYLNIKEKEETRRNEIELKFPYFLTKIILLLNAGFTVPAAWDYISQNATESSVIIDEVKNTNEQIKSGEFQKVAYQNFAKRCDSKRIKRFINNILYNIKRGDSELVNSLRNELNEALINKKMIIKQMAEANNLKTILPLMLIFVAIMILVIFPAIVTIKI